MDEPDISNVMLAIYLMQAADILDVHPNEILHCINGICISAERAGVVTELWASIQENEGIQIGHC